MFKWGSLLFFLPRRMEYQDACHPGLFRRLGFDTMFLDVCFPRSFPFFTASVSSLLIQVRKDATTLFGRTAIWSESLDDSHRKEKSRCHGFPRVQCNDKPNFILLTGLNFIKRFPEVSLDLPHFFHDGEQCDRYSVRRTDHPFFWMFFCFLSPTPQPPDLRYEQILVWGGHRSFDFPNLYVSIALLLGLFPFRALLALFVNHDDWSPIQGLNVNSNFWSKLFDLLTHRFDFQMSGFQV